MKDLFIEGRCETFFSRRMEEQGSLNIQRRMSILCIYGFLKRRVCGIRPSTSNRTGEKEAGSILGKSGENPHPTKKVNIGDQQGIFALHKLCVDEDEGGRVFDKKEPLDSTA